MTAPIELSLFRLNLISHLIDVASQVTALCLMQRHDLHEAPDTVLRRDLLGLLLRRVVSREHVSQRGLGDASSAGNEPRQPPVLGQERGGGRRFDFIEQSALVVGVIRVDDRFR